MSGADWTMLPGAPDPSEGSSRPGVGADEALAGFAPPASAGARPLDRVRLSPIVAGALRAAVDGLVGDLPGRPAMRITADDAVLEVRLERVDPQGLVVAGGVLEAVEASLVPAPHAPRQWIVRTPVLSAVESFLMIERDDLPLALPWHAVSRVRMIRPRDLAAIAAQEGSGVVAGFGPEAAGEEDVPAVLVALGLRRAWLAVDRLVWRLPATPDPESPPPPRAGLGPALLTGDGGHYWLLDLSELMRDVAFPVTPPFGARETAEAAPPAAPPAGSEPQRPVLFGLPAFLATEPTADEEPAFHAMEPTTDEEPAFLATGPATDESLAAPEPAAAAPPSEAAVPARPVLRLVTLSAADVTPLDDEAIAESAEVEPEGDAGGLEAGTGTAAIEAPGDAGVFEVPVIAAEAETAPEPAAEPAVATGAMPDRPRVLMAEDSITARMFLRRLLEQMGFEVHAVSSLRELRASLEDGPWAIVMVDVDLPDARGARVLTGLHARSTRGPAPVVALVRDAEDAAIARSAGVPNTLRKPFERDDLERLMIALHWEVGGA